MKKIIYTFFISIFFISCGGSSSSKEEITEITFNSLTYKVIRSPITGKKWLDRNLGAPMVCNSPINDFTSREKYIESQEDCFGEYYQWGRLADGHEKTTSNSTLAKSSTYENISHSDFIRSQVGEKDWLENSKYDSTNIDDDGKKRSALWNKTDGTGICPLGFRVPSKEELSLEIISYNGENNAITGAIKVLTRNEGTTNFLKIPVAGYRDKSTGLITARAYYTSIWTNSSTSFKSYELLLEPTYGSMGENSRALASSVRCIKD